MTVAREDAERVVREICAQDTALQIGGVPEELSEMFKKWCRDNGMDESVMPWVVDGLTNAFHNNLLSWAAEQPEAEEPFLAVEQDSGILEASLFYFGCGAFRMGYEMAKQFGKVTDVSGWET